ncbi:hypothetical protein [Acetobacter conturbans]|uniref:Uncharacterized protein n=1 Tax=Acetobacter conturbans TaxID=1737472 RepID=A0ABX0K2Z3_9PROT|nr:hypothetical protein [Acetobacter conturbans]NHN89181.1 hypothetical protein [Acetobacter conturbans]
MRSFASKALLGATLLVGAPALVLSVASPAAAHTHHKHHKNSEKTTTGEKTAKKSGESETADLNAKSLSAAQQDKVPAIGTAAPATAAPTAAVPSVAMPSVTAPAAGTGVTAPATTIPTNAPSAN